MLSWELALVESSSGFASYCLVVREVWQVTLGLRAPGARDAP